MGESANDLVAQSISQAHVTVTHGDACRLSAVTDDFPPRRDILRELGVQFSCFFKQILIFRPPLRKNHFKSLSIKTEKSQPVVKCVPSEPDMSLGQRLSQNSSLFSVFLAVHVEACLKGLD